MMPKNPIRLWSSCVFSIVVKTKEVSKIRKLLRCFEVCFPCCSCEISDNLPLADDCREVFCTIDIQGLTNGSVTILETQDFEHFTLLDWNNVDHLETIETVSV